MCQELHNVQHVHIDRFFNVRRARTVQRTTSSAGIVRLDSGGSLAFQHGVVIAEEAAEIRFLDFQLGAMNELQQNKITLLDFMALNV